MLRHDCEALRQRIETLIDERDRAQKLADSWGAEYTKMRAERDTLEAKLADCDAERVRWMQRAELAWASLSDVKL